MAPSLYCWKASAFLAICSASARPLASTAKASASPFTCSQRRGGGRGGEGTGGCVRTVERRRIGLQWREEEIQTQERRTVEQRSRATYSTDLGNEPQVGIHFCFVLQPSPITQSNRFQPLKQLCNLSFFSFFFQNISRSFLNKNASAAQDTVLLCKQELEAKLLP